MKKIPKGTSITIEGKECEKKVKLCFFFIYSKIKSGKGIIGEGVSNKQIRLKLHVGTQNMG